MLTSCPLSTAGHVRPMCPEAGGVSCKLHMISCSLGLVPLPSACLRKTVTASSNYAESDNNVHSHFYIKADASQVTRIYPKGLCNNRTSIRPGSDHLPAVWQHERVNNEEHRSGRSVGRRPAGGSSSLSQRCAHPSCIKVPPAKKITSLATPEGRVLFCGGWGSRVPCRIGVCSPMLIKC